MHLSRRLLCSHRLTGVPDHVLKPVMFPEWEMKKIKENGLKWRLAREEDYAAVAKACDAFHATDYIPAQYSRMLQQPNRRTFVLTNEDGKFISLCSALVLNGGRKLYSCSWRTSEAFRSRRLLSFLRSRSLLRMASEFPNLEGYLWLSRFDHQAFPQRFWPNTRRGPLCTNSVLATLHILHASVLLRDYDLATRQFGAKLRGEVGMPENVRFEDVFQLVTRSGNSNQLFANGYVPIDSQVYPFHEDNFTAKNNLLDTQVYITRRNELIDGITFTVANACPIGLHLKVYHYSNSQTTLHCHLRFALESNSERLKKLRNNEQQLAPFRNLLRSCTFDADRVFFTVVFSNSLDPCELRARLFQAGLGVGASGKDNLETQYVFSDDAISHVLQSRESYFLQAVDRERKYAEYLQTGQCIPIGS